MFTLQMRCHDVIAMSTLWNRACTNCCFIVYPIFPTINVFSHTWIIMNLLTSLPLLCFFLLSHQTNQSILCCSMWYLILDSIPFIRLSVRLISSKLRWTSFIHGLPRAESALPIWFLLPWIIRYHSNKHACLQPLLSLLFPAQCTGGN